MANKHNGNSNEGIHLLVKVWGQKAASLPKINTFTGNFQEFFVDVKQFTFVLKELQNIFFSEHLSVVASVDFTFSNFEVLFKTETTALKCSEKKKNVLGIVKSKCTLLNILAKSRGNTCDGDCFVKLQASSNFTKK